MHARGYGSHRRFWKPVWRILADGEIELLLANAAHVKNVPGRKTDVNDATWRSDLAAHGLIRGSDVSASAAPPSCAPSTTCSRTEPCSNLIERFFDKIKHFRAAILLN